MNKASLCSHVPLITISDSMILYVKEHVTRTKACRRSLCMVMACLNDDKTTYTVMSRDEVPGKSNE